MPSEPAQMGVAQQTRRRLVTSSVAVLSLAATARCSVYDTSLLGNAELTMGGAATMAPSGASGGIAAGSVGGGGIAGQSQGDGGTADSGLGGFSEMAGAIESGGTNTTGGTAGAGSTGGANGGTGGSVAGSAGSPGSIGGAGSAGAGGVVQTATGCAKLSVPLDDAADKAHFVISLASNTDMSGATISMRFYVQAGQGGTIFNYVQDSGTYHFLGVAEANRQLLGKASGWSTVSWDVGKEPDAGTNIVRTSIKNLGIEINALPSSKWSNPTVVYVDSVTVTSPALSFTFNASSSVSTVSNTAGAIWLNTGSTDTTAAGAMVVWQATCP